MGFFGKRITGEYMLEINQIYNEDCLDGLKKIDTSSIDSIISDPPYSLSFMSKEWDSDLPSVEILKECLPALISIEIQAGYPVLES